VIDLGNKDLKALASEAGSQPPDGAGDLVNLGVEDDSGTRPHPFRDEAMDTHRAGGGGNVDVLLILNGHDATKDASWPRFVEVPYEMDRCSPWRSTLLGCSGSKKGSATNILATLLTLVTPPRLPIRSNTDAHADFWRHLLGA
jgi:hypothetical protein